MADREDVARLAGVSSATVSRVINGNARVKRETRDKVNRAIKALDYYPNSIARNLRMESSNMVAVIVDDLCNAYVSECVEIMSREARKYGCYVMLFDLVHDNLDGIMEEIIGNKVRGVVNSTISQVSDRNKQKFARMNIKTINVTIKDELIVQIRYEQAMREAFRLLAEKNKKKPVYMGGLSSDWLEYNSRVQAFFKLSKEFGMQTDAGSVISGTYPRDKYSFIGYRETDRLFKEGREFDSVFCLTDALAIGVLCALSEHGKKIPQEVAVIGCDNIKQSEYTVPKLTTIDTQSEEVYKTYIRYLLSEDKETDYAFDTTLIVRESI